MNRQVPITATPPLHVSVPHDSAIKQVAGRAEYIDDLAEPEGTLHAYLGLSTKAHAEIVSIDLDAVRKAPGVVGVLTHGDMSGRERYQLGAQARRAGLAPIAWCTTGASQSSR
jgi:xanthine dehydrogenase large subunit